MKNKSHESLIQRAKEVAKQKETSPLCIVGEVGSALITDKGNIYVGSSIGLACGLGCCGEYSAITTMLTSGESRIKTIVAVGSDGSILPPCGKCRELIFQINKDNLNTNIITSGGKTKKLKQLLPDVWFKM